jgi:hypothetical protein
MAACNQIELVGASGREATIRRVRGPASDRSIVAFGSPVTPQIDAATLTAILRKPRRILPLTVPIGVSSMVAISVWV